MPRAGTRRNKIYIRDPTIRVLKYLKGVRDNRDWWYTATLVNSPKFAAYQDILMEKLNSPDVISRLEAVEGYDRVKVVGEAVKDAVKKYREVEDPIAVGESVLKAIESLSKEIEERKKAIEALVSLIPT